MPWKECHVMDERLRFAKSVRQQFSPNLQWRPTDNACNSTQRSDEEYFVVSFAGGIGPAIGKRRSRRGVQWSRRRVGELGTLTAA